MMMMQLLVLGLCCLSGAHADDTGAVVPAGVESNDIPMDVYRLPQTLFPEYYKLIVLTHIDDSEGFRFFGNVSIRVNVVENTKNITLHAKDLNISTDSIEIHRLDSNGVADKKLGVNGTAVNRDFDLFTIIANDALTNGSQYELIIPFQGELSAGLYGFYRSSYFDQKSKTKRWLAVTQFEATHARLAFPCFDEPEMKARFEIILGHDANYTAISNMPLKSSAKIESIPGWVLDHFEVSVPMSTYLVAYTINDFESRTSDMGNGAVFKIWARRDAIDQVDYARIIGPKVLQFFEKTFNAPYPLPKMDMIAVPDFSAGAMENWGLITYRETALLFLPNVSSSSSQSRVASVIAHELAHQWFGNLVTMRWWTDLWLNEGFATYVASLGVENLHPEWNSFQEESLSNTMDVFGFDSLKSSHPVSVTIGNPSQISSIFDRISYEKGSSVIRMMHLFLGDEVFFGGVGSYLQKYKYNNAEQDNLWESLTEEAHKHEALDQSLNLKTIMDTWTLQTGYPIITVTRNYENNTATIVQRRFLSDPSSNKLTDSENPCWWVPLSYTTAQIADFNTTEPKAWLECDANGVAVTKELIDLPEDDEWILFNVQISGLYKVKYDERNWNSLIEQLTGTEYDKIATLNRAELINDALDLAWSGDQDYAVALKLIKYLKQEKEYLPWRAALSTLSDVNRMLKRSPQYGLFKEYIQRILLPIYKRLGGLNALRKPGDPLDIVKHKVLISAWSCRFDVSDCQEKSKILFKKWTESKDPEKFNPVPVDLRGVIYCTAIRQGGDREWKFLWTRYGKSNVASERQVILGALGCSREIWLLQRYLDWTLDESTGVRKQDRGIVFHNVASNDIGFLLAKSFLYDRIDTIHQELLPDSGSKIERYLSVLADQMTSDKDYEEIDSFVKSKSKAFEGAERGVKQSLEKIHVNSMWHEKNYDQIGRLLNEY